MTTHQGADMKYLGLDFTPLGHAALSREQLDAFEKEYGVKIPVELKNLYMLSNDSILNYPLVPCDEVEGGVMPERWIGISEFGMNYILDLYAGSIGKEVIPFSVDPGGNLFVVKMEDEKQMGVYYIDLGQISECDGRYSAYRLADDIASFAQLICTS